MIKAIAFDLDDTLLDTTGLLAPQFALAAFTLMIKTGLKLSLSECETLRVDLIRSISHREVFEKLAKTYGTDETIKAIPKVIEIFYEPKLPEKLPLIEGARKNIDYLKTKYRMYLVTAGAFKTQRAKATALGVDNDFIEVIVVDSLSGLHKKDSFLKIIEDEKIKPSELLVIGNSLLSEIKDGIAIGCTTCYFEHGEARGSIADLSHPPNFHIKTHEELISQCRL